MLGPEHCDDHAYAELLQAIGNTGNLPERIVSDVLRAMIARGLGTTAAPEEREKLCTLVTSGTCVPALSYDLTFPEVFYPAGVPHGRLGFHGVLGNPPWDKLNVEKRELMASLDSTFFFGKELAGVGDENQRINDAFGRYPEAVEYEQGIVGTKKVFAVACSRSQSADTVLNTIGNPELYRLFLIRTVDVANRTGRLGFIMGGGLGKNPADAPTRRYLFDAYDVTYFAHFLNLRQLFAAPHRGSHLSLLLVRRSRRWCSPSWIRFGPFRRRP